MSVEAARPGARSGSIAKRTSARSHRRNVLAAYQVRCVITDVVAVVLSAAVAVAVRFHDLPHHVWLSYGPRYASASLLLVVAWLVILAFRGAYDPRFLGVGSEELKRVASGTGFAFASIASASYLLKASISRGFVAVAIPLGLVLLLLGRRRTRRWLSRRRAAGDLLQRTLVVGTSDERTALVATFDQEPGAGFSVVAVLDPPAPDQSMAGWLLELDRLLDAERIDAVTVTRTSTLPADGLQKLAWHLEGPRIDLMVAPAFRTAFGPRTAPRPAADLPLYHLDEPRLSGPQRLAKGAADRILASVLLIALVPLFALVALAIRLTSRGPVFFVQDRIGRRGSTFRCIKFRTMVEGADRMRADVLGAPDAQMPDRYRSDPRITPVGRFLRRWSVDELPQLVNVLVGSMSVVGPRPILLEETHLLGDVDQRRHLTKPGLTGLWQISGRKETTWQERMQLDLDYIERWSPALDLVIIARTLRVVISGSGAF